MLVKEPNSPTAPIQTKKPKSMFFIWKERKIKKKARILATVLATAFEECLAFEKNLCTMSVASSAQVIRTRLKLAVRSYLLNL